MRDRQPGPEPEAEQESAAERAPGGESLLLLGWDVEADRRPPDPPSAPVVEAAARCCQALGSATRLRMLHRLRERPGTLSRDLAEAAGVDPAAATRHLVGLVASRLVRRRRHGRRLICELTPAGEWALEQALALGGVLAELGNAGAPATVRSRDPRTMTWMDGADAELEIDVGVTFHRMVGEEEDWARQMTGFFPEDLSDRLPLLWTVVQRLSRGEKLEGLPLPSEVIDHYDGGAADL